MSSEEPQVIGIIQPRRGWARKAALLLGSLPTLIVVIGFAIALADHTAPPYGLLPAAVATLPFLFFNYTNLEMTFDQRHFTIKEGTKVLEQVPWTDVQGYELTSRFIRILRRGGEPILVALDLRLSPFKTGTLRYGETKVAAILDALEKHMPDTAMRKQGRSAPTEPPTTLVPGTAYVYVDQPLLRGIASSKNLEIWFLAALAAGSAAAACCFAIKVILAFAVAIGCLLIAGTILAVNAIRDRKRWKNFERTIRATLLATEDGVQFRGDTRVFQPLLSLEKSAQTDQGTFQVYRNGKEELYVCPHFLRATTLPLTALSQTSTARPTSTLQDQSKESMEA